MEDSARLSIKDFASFTGLRESTLRYYDSIGLLSPEIRGENRYRYYSPLQTITVEFIKVLTKVGVPLSAIKEMHESRTPQSVLALLTQQENKLDVQLRELQTAYSIIHTYRHNIQAGLEAPDQEMQVRELDETRITLGPETDFSGSDTFYDAFMDFCNRAPEYQIDLNFPTGGYYEDIDAFLRAPAQPARFFSLDPRGTSKRSAGPYLVAHNQGYYGEFGDLPPKLMAYIRAHGVSVGGPLYIIYLLDEISLPDHNKYLSQITVGVSKNR
jgi:DNA-binding transcriptional MerR regulator